MDSIDEKVIGHLLRDGRATYAEIGEDVGLSAPAVKRRVDRLLETGTIRNFTAVVDPEALGWSTEAYVQVYCAGNVSPAQLQAHFEEIPEVVSACTISGSADALLHVLARDVRHLERALERVRAEPSIDHTESVIVLSRLIDRRAN